MLDDVYFDQDSIFDDGKNNEKVQKGYFRPIPEDENSKSSSFSSKVRKEWSNIANFTMKFQVFISLSVKNLKGPRFQGEPYLMYGEY